MSLENTTFAPYNSSNYKKCSNSNYVTNHMYSSDLRKPEYIPQTYPNGYVTDPSYYLAYPYWGAGYLYYRPYYQSPTGAGIINGKCVDGVAASAVTNFNNSVANAFYPGLTCRDIYGRQRK